MSDLISRQDALFILSNLNSAWVGYEKVSRLPTIDAVPVVHGEWKVILAEPWCTFDECKCSVCGVVEYFNKGWKRFDYCPNCGSKMDGERKDDEGPGD